MRIAGQKSHQWFLYIPENKSTQFTLSPAFKVAKGVAPDTVSTTFPSHLLNSEICHSSCERNQKEASGCCAGFIMFCPSHQKAVLQTKIVKLHQSLQSTTIWWQVASKRPVTAALPS